MDRNVCELCLITLNTFFVFKYHSDSKLWRKGGVVNVATDAKAWFRSLMIIFWWFVGATGRSPTTLAKLVGYQQFPCLLWRVFNKLHLTALLTGRGGLTCIYTIRLNCTLKHALYEVVSLWGKIDDFLMVFTIFLKSLMV